MLNWFAVALVYLGLAGTAAGAISLVRPLRLLLIPTRSAAAMLLGASAAVTVAGMLIPARLEHVTDVTTDLDRAMPAWQFSERHRTPVQAPPEAVYRALYDVTVGEIFLLRTLTWIRSPHIGAARESILNPPSQKPFLAVALGSSFIRISDQPPRELVVGTLVAGRVGPLRRQPTPDDFIRLAAPGVAKAAMNVLVAPADGGASWVTTETRVFATDVRTARTFAVYWRLIYPGSALIRLMWLRAIRLRAEA